MLPARAVAALAVAAVQARGRSLAACLPELLTRTEPQQRALAQELTYGTLRFLPRLARFAGAHLRRLPRSRDADVYALVLVGLYELDRLATPQYATVSATVAACRALGKAWAAGLVNAVLRSHLRERRRVVRELEALPEVEHAHPQWLIDALRVAWPQHWRAILAANNTRPPMTLRVNARRTTRDAYLARLAAAGIAGRALAAAPQAVMLETPLPVERLPGFAEGLVSVQDAAAQLAAALLEPAPGQRVLDACAAPGGKTAHLAELEPRLARLVAVDEDPERHARTAATLARLGLTAELCTADAAAPRRWWDGEPFDRILLDAPCTATGVIRRHPDVKALRRPGDVAAMSARQARLLAALWPLLAPHGKLLYATCSVLPAENDECIRAFLAAHPDARVEALPLAAGHDTGAGRQILPGEGDMDGFFYARLSKTAGA